MLNALNRVVMPGLPGQQGPGMIGAIRPPLADHSNWNALMDRPAHTPMGPDNMGFAHGSGINPRTRAVWDRISGRFGGGPGSVPGVPSLPTAPGVPARTNGGYGFTAPQNMVGSAYNIAGASAPSNPYQLPTYTPGQ